MSKYLFIAHQNLNRTSGHNVCGKERFCGKKNSRVVA